MNYVHLESFYAVVKYNGFTRAAAHMNKAQSAISAQVALLEKELGVKLYEVVAKKVQPTPSGRRLYESIAPFFEGLIDLQRSIQNPEEGHLAIASSQNNILYRLRAPLQRLRERFPKVRLRLITIDSHQAVEVLRSGDADLAVVRMPVDLPPDIEFIRLPTTPIALIAPLGHPISRKKSVTPAEICAYPLVAYHPEEWLRRHCDRVFQSHGCTPDIVLEARSAEIVKAYVRAGFGLAIVASLDFVVRPDPELHVIPVDRYFGHDLTTALMRRGRFQPPYVRFLLDLLADSPARGGARAESAGRR
ncbi:MAG: LysR family transcriptional regulator [Candidatus Rokubacteria bacterium]|nr:LysR family transcriptional regulator [Candidatus Rokubacteria bacterium]